MSDRKRGEDCNASKSPISLISPLYHATASSNCSTDQPVPELLLGAVDLRDLLLAEGLPFPAAGGERKR